jgi:hypothetical protein
VCSALASLVKAQACYDFGPGCQAILNNLALASRVKAQLALDPATHHLEFDVSADNGAVSIRGKLTSIDLLPEVERIAGGGGR